MMLAADIVPSATSKHYTSPAPPPQGTGLWWQGFGGWRAWSSQGVYLLRQLCRGS